jgi:mannan endo-1,4-beta-mannosidase
LAARAKKPVLLEEFGYVRFDPDSAEAYAMWLDTLTRDPNCAGWVVWRLVSRQDSGRYPVDEHDQFDIRNDGSASGTSSKPPRPGRASETIRETP